MNAVDQKRISSVVTSGRPETVRTDLSPEGRSDSRILIGMLFSGERQIHEAISSIEEQAGVDVDLVLVAWHPNIAAHRTLYQAFMASQKDYAWFAKIDADMRLLDPHALRNATSYLLEHEADHGVFAVWDWLSNRPLMGVHVMASHVGWEIPPDEQLFVDPDPTGVRRRVVVESSPAPLAVHNEEPGPFEAFSFGIHRALKVRQPWSLPGAFRCTQARRQLELLRSVRHAARARPHRTRTLALLGAQRILTTPRRGLPREYRSDESRGWFDETVDRSNEDLWAQAARFWTGSVAQTHLRTMIVLRCGLVRLLRATSQRRRDVGTN